MDTINIYTLHFATAIMHRANSLSNKIHFKDAVGPLVGTNKAVPLSANIGLWLFQLFTVLVKVAKTEHQCIN